MTRFVSIKLAAVLVLCCAGWVRVSADTTNSGVVFSEVYELVRANLRGLTAAELDHAAVTGLLAALGQRVSLVTNGTARPSSPMLGQKLILEDNVAYVRVRQVADGLAEALAEAHRELSRTGKVVGLVLDLRFAGGDDYASASEVAALFLKTSTALLDWGAGAAKVEPAAKAITRPVAILVNRETSGAAEALAAAVREAGAGLILGTQTGGTAAKRQEFTLTTGQKLLIATSPVKLADGTELSPRGVRPDIEVIVSREDERAFFADPYREPPKPAEWVVTGETGPSQVAGTNRATRRSRTTEADLVRARREGLPLDGELAVARETEPPRPILRDPALARAVDLLKGLAVVRQPRS